MDSWRRHNKDIETLDSSEPQHTTTMQAQP